MGDFSQTWSQVNYVCLSILHTINYKQIDPAAKKIYEMKTVVTSRNALG